MSGKIPSENRKSRHCVVKCSMEGRQSAFIIYSTEASMSKYRIAKCRTKNIETQNIEAILYRIHKISMGQDIEIAEHRIAILSRNISHMHNVE